MTSRPRSYNPPKYAVPVPGSNDEEDIFSARPSTLPKHLRPVTSSDTPSPPSSGYTTPALSTRSSDSFSSSSPSSRQSLPASSPLTERKQRHPYHPYPAGKRLHRHSRVPSSDPADETFPPRPPPFILPLTPSLSPVYSGGPVRNKQPRPLPPVLSAHALPAFQGVPLDDIPPSAHLQRDHLAHAHLHAHQHSGSAPQSTPGSTRGFDDGAHNRGSQDRSGADSHRPPSSPGGSAFGGDGRGRDGKDRDNGNDRDDSDHYASDDGVQDEPDYGGVGPAYDDAWSHPKLEKTGGLQVSRHYDLSKAFHQTIFPYFVGRCAPCAVRGLEHDHHLDKCTYGFGCSFNEPAYSTWHYKALTLADRKWCTFCVTALPSGGGWHPDGFGRRCPYSQILKPALWTLFTQHAPAPHISTSDLVPPALFEDDTPGLYALCEWAQTPVAAQPGILNLHVLLLWVFDLVGVLQIPESCRPLVTELAARTAQSRAE